MNFKSISIRPFIGAKDYSESRKFYTELGFKETIIDAKMSLFRVDDSLAFYLQDYYKKDWIDNLMVLLEVEDILACEKDLKERNLHNKYKRVSLSPIKDSIHGREIFMHDPSGVLWHFYKFN